MQVLEEVISFVESDEEWNGDEREFEVVMEYVIINVVFIFHIFMYLICVVL